MSRFLKDWLVSSNEDNKTDEAPVIVQDGETPKDDFSDATNEQSGDVDTAKPAVAEIDAASDGDSEHKTTDQGHQKVTVSSEDESGDDDKASDDDESEEAEESDESDDEESESDDDESEADAGEEGEVEPPEGEGEPVVEVSDDGAEGETTDADAEEVEEVKEEAESGEEAESDESDDDDHSEESEESDDEDEKVSTESADGDEAEDTGSAGKELDDTAKAEDTGDLNEAPAKDAPEVDAETNADPKGAEVSEGGAAEGDADKGGDGQVNVSVEDDEDVAIDIDADTADKSEVAEEMEQVAADGVHFEKVSESLEAYHALLTTALDHGGVDAITAESVRIGLEHMDEAFGGSSVVMSMEAFGETSSKIIATRISMEGVGDALKKTIEVGKRILKKLFELIYESFSQLTSGVGKAKERLSKVKGKVSALTTESVSESVQLKSANTLTVDGEFSGLSMTALKNLKDVADYMYVTYPKSCVAFAKEYDEIIRTAFPAAGAQDGANREWSRMVALPGKHFSAIPGKSIVSNDTDKTVLRSHILPGNRALVTSFNNEKAFKASEVFNVKISTFNISKYMSINFEQLDDVKSGGEVKLDLPTKRQMTQVVSELDLILKKLDNVGKAKAQYAEVEKLIGAGMYSTTKGETEAYINRYTGVGRVMTNPTGPFISYLGRTVNAYVTFLEYCVAVFEKALKAEDKQGAAATA